MDSHISRNKTSKRVRKDRTSSTTLTGIPGNEADSSSASLQPSPSVNAKGKQHAVAFDFFQDLPADILGEIVSYLEPVDLLHLARTTRELRSFLINASSSVFWKRARQNDPDLPRCPDDLSEPAYAHLLFLDICHKCLADDRNVLLHLEARTQLCEPCTLEEFKRWQELPEKVDTTLAELVPDTMQQLTAKEKKQNYRSRPTPEYQKAARTRFHVKTAMRLHEQYRKLRGAEKASWLTEQQIASEEFETHARQCRNYVNSQRWKGQDQIWMARMLRAGQINDRLVKLGYGDEFRDRSKFWKVELTSSNGMGPLIYQDHELTDAEWAGMRDGLVQWMQEIRVAREWESKLNRKRQRVESSLGDAYSTFALSQPAGAMLPTLAELAFMEDFAQALSNVPLDDDMPGDALDSAIAKIPELVEGWQLQLENSLLDLLRQSSAYSGRRDLTKDVLSYASTLFTCTRCVGVLTYPSIFVHPCFSKSIELVDNRSMAPGRRTKKGTTTTPTMASQRSQNASTSGALVQATFAYMPLQLTCYHTWHPGSYLQFNEAMHYHTRSILDQLGMPQTTAITTLLNLNPYLEGTCKCFIDGSKKQGTTPRKASRWLQALLPCRRHRSRDYGASFDVMDEAQLQALTGYSAALPTPDRLRCFWCGILLTNMVFHLTISHGMSQINAIAASQLAPCEIEHRDCTVQIDTVG